MSFSKVEGKFEILFCRSGCRRCSVKKGFLKTFVSFIGKQLCCSFFLIKLQNLRPVTLVKRGSNTGFFYCSICEILKSTYFDEHRQTAASLFGEVANGRTVNLPIADSNTGAFFKKLYHLAEQLLFTDCYQMFPLMLSKYNRINRFLFS